MYWVPLLVFLAHMIEEYPRFPAWATRHFGATSQAWYVYSHAVLVALIITACGWASGAPPQTVGPVLVLAIQVSLAANAVFHLACTVLFREYSPGVVTGVGLLLPATVWLVGHAVAHDLLGPARLGLAVGLGVLSQVAVIASLWLPMDIDWRFRRPSRPPSPTDRRSSGGPSRGVPSR